MDLNDGYYFTQVVEHAGFAAAARALGAQKSLLSRRVAALEAQLGVRLLQRSSCSFSVTDVGREFHPRCAAMVQEARAAEQVAAESQAVPRGVVRITCPVALLERQLDGQTWIVGDKRTIADADATPMLNWAASVLPEKLGDLPNVSGHRTRMRADPAVRRAMAAEELRVDRG